MSGMNDDHEGRGHRCVEEGGAVRVTLHLMRRDWNAKALMSRMEEKVGGGG